MKKYINVKLYTDIESYEVYDIDWEKDTAMARRVKRDFTPKFVGMHCVNQEDQKNCDVIPDPDYEPIKIQRKSYGVWGYWTYDRLYCWAASSFTPEGLAEQLQKEGNFLEKGADGKYYLCIYRMTKDNKKGRKFVKLGMLEDTCKYFYDYNF